MVSPCRPPSAPILAGIEPFDSERRGDQLLRAGIGTDFWGTVVVQMDLERRLPCATGIIDAAGFVGCLEAIGYDGPVTVEPFDAELEKQEPEEIAKQVIDSAKRMLASGES